MYTTELGGRKAEERGCRPTRVRAYRNDTCFVRNSKQWARECSVRSVDRAKRDGCRRQSRSDTESMRLEWNVRLKWNVRKTNRAKRRRSRSEAKHPGARVNQSNTHGRARALAWLGLAFAYGFSWPRLFRIGLAWLANWLPHPYQAKEPFA
jgi:hypothetical protein